jgi:hypothetical protein
MSTVAHDCYQMVKIATDKDVISCKTVAIEGHSSDWGFVASSMSHCRNRSQDVRY